MVERVLEVRGLVKSFPARGARATVLAGVNLDIARGEGVAVLGANGSGKSTLLKTVVGLLLPDAGSVRILGGDPTKPRSRRSVGFASGDERWFTLRLTARQNLEFFARLHGLDPVRLRESIHANAAEMGVEGELDRPVHELATGIRALFGVVRSLLHAPPLLVLDEPSRSLDETRRGLLSNAIRRRLELGLSVLMATHDLPLVSELGFAVFRTDSTETSELAG